MKKKRETGKYDRDEFHMQAITPFGVFGTRKKGDEEHQGILSKSEVIPGGELVRVKSREGEPILDLKPAYATTKGPAQVATADYRKGYDRIFGTKKNTKHEMN